MIQSASIFPGSYLIQFTMVWWWLECPSGLGLEISVKVHLMEWSKQHFSFTLFPELLLLRNCRAILKWKMFHLLWSQFKMVRNVGQVFPTTLGFVPVVLSYLPDLGKPGGDVSYSPMPTILLQPYSPLLFLFKDGKLYLPQSQTSLPLMQSSTGVLETAQPYGPSSMIQNG